MINADREAIRVVAGPGTGKTFGLVRRVERILHPKGLAADGAEVLVVAFNRVIAKQLAKDIAERLKTFEHKRPPIIRTIHALCLDVIGERLRLLMEHEREAMIYDVIERYPEIGKEHGGYRSGSYRGNLNGRSRSFHFAVRWDAVRSYHDATRSRASLN